MRFYGRRAVMDTLCNIKIRMKPALFLPHRELGRVLFVLT